MKKHSLLIIVVCLLIINCKQSKECYILKTYKNGNTEAIICVQDEKTESFAFKEYYENGILKKTYFSKMKQIIGENIEYYPSGLVKSKYNFKENLRHGSSINYFEDGKTIEFKCNYKGGLLNGPWINYFKDGKTIESKYHYKDGLRDGLCIKYFKDGKTIKSKDKYKEDLLHGVAIDYFKDGKTIKSKCEYKKGLRHGLCVDYLKNGRKSLLNYCLNGVSTFVETYKYDSLGIHITSVCAPIVELDKDTIFSKKETLSFKVTMLIPDSIFNQRSSVFKYGLKSLSLKKIVFIVYIQKQILNLKYSMISHTMAK